MTTSPTPIQPVEVIGHQTDLTEAQAALTEFERAFILSGTRAEFKQGAHIIVPIVNGTLYEFVLPACTCSDLECWYVRGKPSWFYSVCHAHRLQPLGRATRPARDVDADRRHKARRGGDQMRYASRWG